MQWNVLSILVHSVCCFTLFCFQQLSWYELFELHDKASEGDHGESQLPGFHLMVICRSYSGEKFCGSSELKQMKSLSGLKNRSWEWPMVEPKENRMS